MKMTFLFFLPVILLVGCKPKDRATGLESLQGVSVEYYDISGATADELRADLSVKHPTGPDGYKGDAATLWDIKWNWKGYGTHNCDLNTVTVSYSIRVILPRWVTPVNADSTLIRNWNEYIDCLLEHEKGHIPNVIEQSGQVKNAILRSNCDNAEGAAQAVLAAIRLNDFNYDKETDHGATLGARFPR